MAFGSTSLSKVMTTDGTAPAPAITLEWSVPVDNPYFVPLLVAGGILLLAGLGEVLRILFPGYDREPL